MRMDTGIDTGDMIAKRTVPIEEEDTGGSLFDKLAEVGAKLLVDTIPSIVDGTATYTKQDEACATKVGMIQKSQGVIDFHRSAKEINCQIRALNPWPSAYTKLHGKTLKIWKAKVVASDGNYEPGSIARITKDELCIATGEGLLSVLEVQLEGKKRMATADFLRGVTLAEGEMLGE